MSADILYGSAENVRNAGVPILRASVLHIGAVSRLKELTAYFENKERRSIEERQQEKRILLKQQETKQKERREFQIDQKRRRKEEEREEEILKSCNYYLKFGIIAGSIFVIYTVLFIIYYPPTHSLRSFIDMLFTFCSSILLFSIIAMIIDIRLRSRILRRYK